MMYLCMLEKTKVESVSHMQLLVYFCVFSFRFTSITVNWNFVFNETLNKRKLKLNYLQLYKLSVIVKLKGKSYFSRSSISI